jgi:hypothetical protein
MEETFMLKFILKIAWLYVIWAKGAVNSTFVVPVELALRMQYVVFE